MRWRRSLAEPAHSRAGAMAPGGEDQRAHVRPQLLKELHVVRLLQQVSLVSTRPSLARYLSTACNCTRAYCGYGSLRVRSVVKCMRVLCLRGVTRSQGYKCLGKLPRGVILAPFLPLTPPLSLSPQPVTWEFTGGAWSLSHLPVPEQACLRAL